jgi:ribosome modulation factor
VIRTATEAQREAERRYPRSQGFQAAFVNGWQFRHAGRPIDACPYASGLRRRANRKGWSPAWREAWIGGWQSAGET